MLIKLGAVPVLMATMALVACSGDSVPSTVEPSVEASPEATATAIIPTTAATAPSESAAAEATSTEAGEVVPTLVAATPTQEREQNTIHQAEPTPTPLPWVDFPGDVAVLVQSYRASPKRGGGPPYDLWRIYRENGDGRIVRERLFSTPKFSREECGDVYEEDGFSVDYSRIPAFSGQLPKCGGYYFGLVGSPDASSIFMTVCVEYACNLPYFTPGQDADDPPGRTAIYESRDGGVTWERLVGFDKPWIADLVLPDGDGDDRLLLSSNRSFNVGGPWEFPDPILWPDGRAVTPPKSPKGYGPPIPWNRVVLHDGRLAWGFEQEEKSLLPAPERAKLYLTEEGEDVTELVLEQTDSCPRCLMLPDGRELLLRGREYYVGELVGGAAAEYYSDPTSGHYPNGTPASKFWPTIRDPETGEQWPVKLPYDVLSLDNLHLLPIAIQRGPFLRVVNVDDCLPLRAEPSHDAEELACAVERVLLTDLAEAMELDGTTWRSVRTSAGVVGWADGRYLE